MICPCKSRIACAGDDNPFTGFDTDAADCCTKIGVQYGVGGQLPALGSNWVNSNCVAFADACDQDTADSLALSGYFHCVALNNRTPPAFDFVDPPDVPTPWDVDVFGNTPQTCSALCPDGLLFSFTVRENQFFALSQIEADNMAHSFACRQLAINQVCMGSLIPNECCLNQTYSAFISATGVFGPFVFTVASGSIPTGMLLTTASSSAVKLSGNPSMAGTFKFSLQATDTHSNFMVKAYTLNVISISTGAIPQATVGSAYSFNLTTTGTFSAPVTWSIVSGSLPAGLVMNSSGAIVGTPTTVGDSAFTVQVGDGTVTCQKAFTIHTQSSAPPLACIALVDSINVTAIDNDEDITPTFTAASRRLVAYNSIVPEIRFVNTQTDAVIATVALPASITFPGAFATSVSKFYFATLTQLRVYDQNGVFVTQINLTGTTQSNAVYDPITDRVFILTDANNPNYTLTSVNPNTDTVVTNLNTGVGISPGALSFYYSGNIVVDRPTSFDVFSLPGFVAQGSINSGPGGSTNAFCFDTATSKIFIGAFNAGTFNPEVWEVNATTFVVEHVYAMVNTLHDVHSCAFDPVTGAVIATTHSGQLTVINPITHTIVCSLELGDTGSGLAVDYVSGRVFKARSDTGFISVFA